MVRSPRCVIAASELAHELGGGTFGPYSVVIESLLISSFWSLTL